MARYEKKIADAVSAGPQRGSLMASVGGTTASNLGGPNYGELVIHLKPRAQRQLGVNDIIKELRPQAGGRSRSQGRTCRIRRPSSIGGQVTKSLYQFSMQTPDQGRALRRRARSWPRQCEKLPGVEDVTSDVAVRTHR